MHGGGGRPTGGLRRAGRCRGRVGGLALAHLWLQPFPVRPGSLAAISGQRFSPIFSTIWMRMASSWGCGKGGEGGAAARGDCGRRVRGCVAARRSPAPVSLGARGRRNTEHDFFIGSQPDAAPSGLQPRGGGPHAPGRRITPFAPLESMADESGGPQKRLTCPFLRSTDHHRLWSRLVSLWCCPGSEAHAELFECDNTAVKTECGAFKSV